MVGVACPEKAPLGPVQLQIYPIKNQIFCEVLYNTYVSVWPPSVDKHLGFFFPSYGDTVMTILDILLCVYVQVFL